MMFLLQVITFYFENISILKMHDTITRKITILTAKDKILTQLTIIIPFYSSHRVRLCSPRRLTNFTSFSALSCASRSEKDRITLLPVQGVGEAKKEGRRERREGWMDGGGQARCWSLFSLLSIVT